METERPMSILPAIKCSDCGVEIEISSMGNHVCPKQADDTTPLPSTTYSGPTSPIVDKASLSPLLVNQTSWKRAPPRPIRTAPPRINPSVANHPYVQRELLSPDGPTSGSVASSHRDRNTPRSPMLRSATSPPPRNIRPPSFALSSNMDCAFPPFPTARSVSASASSSASRPKSPAPNSSHHAPRSPSNLGGANVMQRMDTIAPGPFNARTTSKSPPLVQQSPTESTRREPRGSDRSSGPSPSQTQSTPVATNREGRPIPQRPVRPEPLDGFLAMLKNENDASESDKELGPALRASTFPLPPNAKRTPDQDNESRMRRPSEPSSKPSRPALSSAKSAPGRVVPPAELYVQVPPVPSVSTAPKQNSYTVHAPSDSASSSSSTRSFRSDQSPPVSASSSVSMLSSTLGDLSRDNDSSLFVPSLQIKNKSSNLHLSPDDAVKPTNTSSDQNSPTARRVDKTRSATNPSNVSDAPKTSFATPRIYQDAEFPESPVVPDFLPKCGPSYSESATPTPIASPPSEHEFEALRKAPSPFPAKRPGTSSKHHCRGCNEPITGKSVKAADGRLTGRYHKHCFVCKTCRSPFATADFYVIDNNPYCEHHYHQLNNSLCTHCDRGIEGPYLETQQNQKFHPGCFTCLDCHKMLSDDYFEIAGKVYCEQHAFTALRRQEGLGPKRNMERRTTRFMMM